MAEEQNPIELLAQMALPVQDLSRLTFCNSNKPAKLAEWASDLKATQISHTSVVLYKALPELSKLKCNYSVRMEMLELLRPRVQHCITGLTREFLNQPVALPETAQKTAIVAQALQKQMLDGYLVCLADCIKSGRLKQQTYTDLSQILHRAITAISLIFYRGFQLYTQPPQGLWKSLHALYQISEYYELNEKSVVDALLETTRTTTISAAYIRTLLLAASRPNQLNQHDVTHLNAALETWSELVKLNKGITSNKNNLFIVNLSAGTPPIYKNRFDGKQSDFLLEIDMGALLGILAKISTGESTSQSSGIRVAADFPAALLQHALDAWGHVAQRGQERRPVQATAEICAGLTDCHQAIAGGMSFNDFTGSINLSNPLNDREYGDFHSSVTPNGERSKAAAMPANKVSIVNASPGGYCLLWKDKMPSNIQAGEIIAIKELGRLHWSVAVIRWVKQLKQASQLGIKVISQHPKASAIAQVYDMGGHSDYMRAIHVSQKTDGRTQPTLITATAPFGEGGKAKLLNGEQTLSIKLGKCLFSTSNIKQFAFTQLEQTQDEEPRSRPVAPPSKQSFDSSWDDD
ncbi:PilZ domain-containing protein [Saccharophagus degradans]|uniref:PilZ domain-containing protein n=1 Tax=Saccharophagus degradans TaxID=86304 RepID=UPI001C086E3A|nr:PilZ domain-containing protein [Saccharophagus degradans]MBU2985516.1 PilZ domain-containing protein [Saccharophagus degradans]